MSVFSRLRCYHAALAVLAISAYLSEDLKILHIWTGYTLAALICLRLLASFLFPRFLTPPHWLIGRRDLSFKQGLRSPVVGKGILAAIMGCISLVIATGVTLDQKWLAPAVAQPSVATSAYSGESGREVKKSGPERAVKEVHEVAANLLFLIVTVHVAYLLWLRSSYALSMVFLDRFVASGRGRAGRS